MVSNIKDEHQFADLYGADGGLIVDVRDLSDSHKNGLPIAVHLDIFNQNFAEYFSNLDRNTPILIYCTERSRSRGAIRILGELGFTRLFQLIRNL